MKQLLKHISLLMTVVLANKLEAQTFIKTESVSNIIIGSATSIVTSGDMNIEVPVEISKNARIVTNGNVSVRANIRGKGILQMTGSTPTELRGGGYNIYNLVIDNPAGVTLKENARIAEELIFSQGIFKADNNYLVLDPDAIVSGSGPTSFLATMAGGELRKEVDVNYTDAGNLSITAPVGVADENTIAYLPITLNISNINTSEGSQNGAAYISIKANAGTPPNKPTIVTDYINNYWNIDFNNVGQNVTATYSAQYAGDGSLHPGTIESKLKPATWDVNAGADKQYWSFATTSVDELNNTFSGSINKSSVLVSAMNLHALADIKVFLEGAFSGSTGKMTNTLNPADPTKKLLPTTSPYAASTAYYNDKSSSGSVPASFFVNNPNIVDWILVEIRDNNNPSTILSKQSAFVDVDGNIINTDGGRGIYVKDLTHCIISIKHRNHLGVLSVRPGLSLANGGVVPWNFSSSEEFAYNMGFANPRMQAVALSSTIGGGTRYVLHRGDIIATLGVINNTDINSLTGWLNSSNPKNDIYNTRDLNFSRTLNNTDLLINKSKFQAGVTNAHIPN